MARVTKPKLVRDRIPQIILEDGKGLKVRVIKDDGEFLEFLDGKLKEEIKEMWKEISDEAGDNFAEISEEIGDTIDVLYTIAELYGYDESDIDRKRHNKKVARGGFDLRIILEEYEK